MVLYKGPITTVLKRTQNAQKQNEELRRDRMCAIVEQEYPKAITEFGAWVGKGSPVSSITLDGPAISRPFMQGIYSMFGSARLSSFQLILSHRTLLNQPKPAEHPSQTGSAKRADDLLR